jgi:hypothetical protein
MLHNEEVLSICSSSHIILVIITRRMIWTGHVARIMEIHECEIVLRDIHRNRPLRTQSLISIDNI